MARQSFTIKVDFETHFQSVKKILQSTVSQNAMANVTRTVLQIFLAFGGNYLIVRSISPERYGVAILTATFASFINMVDLGISTALIRFVAASGNQRNQFVSAALLIYSGLGLLAIGILLAIQWGFASYFFKSSTPPFSFILLNLMGAFLALLLSIFTNTLNGLQLMKRSGLVELVKSFSFYSLTLLLLGSQEIFAFAYATIGSNLLGLFIAWFCIAQKTALTLVWPSGSTIKQLLQFGLKSYSIALVSQWKFSFLKLLVSWFFELRFVTYLELALRMVGYLRQLLSSLTTPLLPAAALWQAQQKVARIRMVYRLSFLGISGLAGVAVLGTILITPWLIPWWLGSEYQPVIILVQILSLATFFNMLSTPGFVILQGLNWQRPLILTAWGGLFFYLTLPLLFNQSVSFILIGYLFSELIVNLSFVNWLWRKSLLAN